MTIPRRLLLSNKQGLGDVVMLSAVVRDLAQQYPREFEIACQTPYPDLWLNNPFITPIAEDDPYAARLDCHYPLIHHCNKKPYHFIHGFHRYLSEKLKVRIEPTAFHGDVHLSEPERKTPGQIQTMLGQDVPYWLIIAGGKRDFTIKWWEPSRWQKVVDHFRGRIQFVQVGKEEDRHPLLDGVIDLRGKTTLRQLILLVYHAQGVFCPVTCLMHLAAAVPIKENQYANPKMPNRLRLRPCVVVAGGREPAHWEEYPGHQFIHTIGALPCCAHGGCWRSRSVPLNDGDQNDKNLCLDMVGPLPRCMHLITPEEVIRRIELYFEGGACKYLERDKLLVEAPTLSVPKPAAVPCEKIEAAAPHNEAQPFKAKGKGLTEDNVILHSDQFIQRIPHYPQTFKGRGIVICGGGLRYFTCAWVCIKMLRRSGCSLPVQLWHLGKHEMDSQMKSLLAPLGVECIDGAEVRKAHPVRVLNGWESKPYSIIHCPYREVMLLDADNVPVENPEFLFETPQFKETGAIFWPDFGRLGRFRSIWPICGVEYRDEPEFETGQIVVDKEKCWRPLQLTMWYNENSDFYYQHIHGDKETFHMAWRKLGVPYSMPKKPIRRLPGVMCQHDFQDRRIFQHRNLCKWTLYAPNSKVPGFLYEKECHAYLEELRQLWPGRSLLDLSQKTQVEREDGMALVSTEFEYHRVGHDKRRMTFQQNGIIGKGAAGCEVFWDIITINGQVCLEISSETELTCRLYQDGGSAWKGQWEHHERMPIELTPVRNIS